MDEGHSHRSDWSGSFIWNLLFLYNLPQCICAMHASFHCGTKPSQVLQVLSILYGLHLLYLKFQLPKCNRNHLKPEFSCTTPPPWLHTSSKLMYVIPTQKASIFQPNHFNLLDTALWICSNLHTGYT